MFADKLLQVSPASNLVSQSSYYTPGKERKEGEIEERREGVAT